MPYVEPMTREELDRGSAATLGTTGVDPRTGYRPPEISPTSEQVWTAAFQQSSMVVNLAERMFRETYPEVDGYSPLPEIKDTVYEQDYGDRFIHSKSPQETAQIKSEIDRELHNHEIMAQGGVGGVIAGMVAGNLDPTLFLPGAVGIKAARTGIGFGRAALSVAPAVAAQTGIQEAALQLNQQTRTAGESVANVATSTIVGAVLGGGATRLLTGPEVRYVTKQVDLLRRDMDIAAAGGRSVPSTVAAPSAPPVTTHKIAGGEFETLGGSPAMASGASGLSAAATDERAVELVSTPGLGWTKSWSPTRQVLSAASMAARRILIDLADVPYRFTASLTGTSVVQGPAVDLLVKMQMEGAKYELSQELTRLYGNMRFQKENTIAPRARAAMEDLTGSKGMSYTEFKRQAFFAAMVGDTHTVPEVAAAAQYVRKRIFDPVSEEAKRTLPGFKMIEPVDGETYVPHMWDRQKLIDNPKLFTDNLTDHYMADQQYKFGLQQQLRWKNAQLATINENKSKLEAMAARAEAAAHDIDVRAAERSRDDMGKVVGLNETDVPGGRVAELQVRKVTKADEAKEIADMLDLLDELQKGNIVIPKIQKRTLGQFEQAEKESITATAQHKEAGIAAGRSERRLAFLERKLSEKQSRKELIEDQILVANYLHDEIRKSIEEDIAKWQGSTTVDAKSAIKARQKSQSQKAAEQAFLEGRGEGPQLPEAAAKRSTSADDAVDKAVRDILKSNRELTREEMLGIANQTYQRIIGSPDGRLAYDGDGNPVSKIGRFAGPDEAALRGSEASRVLNVTNSWAKDWLVDDIEQVAASYMRTFVPDIHLTSRFGDAELNTAKRLVDEDYIALKRDAKTVAEARAIQREHEEVIKNLAAIRDRTRGVYGWNANGENMARVAKGVKTANNIMLMGSSAVASLVDLTGTVWRQGLLSTFSDGWLPFVKALADPEFRTLWKQHTAEMRAMGIGVETALGLRQHSLDDITDSIRPHSKFERGLDWVGDKFFVANLLNPLTDMEKLIAGHVAMSNIIRGSRALAVGKATQKQIADLADVGIDQGMAQRIWENFSAKQHRLDAIQENGVYIANTADWADRQAALVLNGAVRHDVDIAVVTPGQEKPKWMSKPVIGLLGQFKSFTAAAMERTLIANIQRRDMASLQGLIASTAAGGMVYALQQVLAGKEVASDPGTFAREAMARAGWPAWGEEANSFMRKMTGFDLYSPITDKESTKYQSRRALDTALGPTWTNLQNVASVIKGGAAQAKGFVFGKTADDGSGWTASTTTALRRLMPIQNGIGIRRAYDAVETGFNNAFGVKPKREPNPP